MTKQRRTVTLSRELDGVIGLLATSKQMNYSEFVESRLRSIPEIQKELQKLQELPDLPTTSIPTRLRHVEEQIPTMSEEDILA